MPSFSATQYMPAFDAARPTFGIGVGIVLSACTTGCGQAHTNNDQIRLREKRN